MRRPFVLALLFVTALIPLRAQDTGQDNWYPSGLVNGPIAVNQLLAEGRHNDLQTPFREEVDVVAAATVTGFIAIQRLDVNNVVLHEQPMQVGLGATPIVHFSIGCAPGDYLRLVNKSNVVSGIVAASLLYTN